MKRARAQDPQTARTFTQVVTREVKLRYLLYLPRDYDAKGRTRWPLLLFLHGAGERGADLKKVMVHGPPKLIQGGTNFPFLVVSPQCPADRRWDDEELMGLLDEVIGEQAVDTSRVWVTGLSMGGYGTWSLGTKHPERFAAIVPICGGGEVIDILLANRRNGAALKSLGVWAFHGAKDPVVPLAESERMVDNLKRAGCADVRLTVYPEADHDSWTATYLNPQVYEWLLSRRRK
jgi:predicted peptidase